jgi:predicted  nucleic acid-binding Zn-ribbon protein
MFDLQRFQHQKNQVKKNMDTLKQEVVDVRERKKHLQNKAHTNSGHADKMKLFISDKLLEYMNTMRNFYTLKASPQKCAITG